MPKANATKDLLFVGVNRRVIALQRSTGELVWNWKAPSGTGFVAVLPDRDLVFVCVSGYTHALEATTGREVWHNPLKGFGTGIPCLATHRVTTQASGGAAAQYEADQTSSS
jgi:outer membrane protein assembly factor BamB